MNDIIEIEYLKANIRKLAVEMQTAGQEANQSSPETFCDPNFIKIRKVFKSPVVNADENPSSCFDKMNEEKAGSKEEDLVSEILVGNQNRETVSLNDLNENIKKLIDNTKFYKEIEMIPHVNKFNNNLLRRFIISCDRAEKNLNIETAEENLRFVESLMSKLNDDLFIMMEAISPKTFKQFRYNIITLFQENSMMNLTYNHANPDQNLSTLEYVKSLSLLKAECQFYREFGLEGKISNLEMDKILRYRISMERQCYGDADNVIACMKTVDKLDFSSYMG